MKPIWRMIAAIFVVVAVVAGATLLNPNSRYYVDVLCIGRGPDCHTHPVVK